MSLLARAISFAAAAHANATRKGTKIPYIVHPMEAATIAATMTDDVDVLAAAVLHDVMEDCGVSHAEMCMQFNARVADLVREESICKGADARKSWNWRKYETIARIIRGSRDAKIVALSDKLSNIRAISRDFRAEGEKLFLRFNQHDMRRHAWYYRSCTAALEGELGDTDAWKELHMLVESVFSGVDSSEPEEEELTCAV